MVTFDREQMKSTYFENPVDLIEKVLQLVSTESHIEEHVGIGRIKMNSFKRDTFTRITNNWLDRELLFNYNF